MAKWRVALTDGREISVFAPDEQQALRQALHAESSRVVIATKRGQQLGPDTGLPYAAHPLTAEKIKD
jgi:hypothetical protein